MKHSSRAVGSSDMRTFAIHSLTSGVVLGLTLCAVGLAQESEEDRGNEDRGAGEARVESIPLALAGLDPIRLLEHEEVEGDPLLSVAYDGLLYRFASDRTRREFAKDPQRYAVQLGGACARMGPGVEGEPELFAVHPTGIYLFGTEQCLDAFLEHPEQYVLPPLQRLEPSSSERREARELLERAVGALGKKALRRLEGYRLVGVEERGSRSTPFELWLSLDGRSTGTGAVRRKRLVGEEAIVETWDGERGSVVGHGAPEPLPSWLREELLHEAAVLDALTVLHGVDLDHVVAKVEDPVAPGTARWVRLEVAGSSGGPGRAAAAAGDENPGQIALEIDRHSGRVTAMRFRGRGPGGRAGWITRRFDDFRPTGDLFLPYRREDAFEDREEAFRSVKLERAEAVRLDPDLLELAGHDR